VVIAIIAVVIVRRRMGAKASKKEKVDSKKK